MQGISSAFLILIVLPINSERTARLNGVRVGSDGERWLNNLFFESDGGDERGESIPRMCFLCDLSDAPSDDAKDSK